jgi:lysyl-tRNA synthetase class 2
MSVEPPTRAPRRRKQPRAVTRRPRRADTRPSEPSAARATTRSAGSPAGRPAKPAAPKHPAESTRGGEAKAVEDRPWRRSWAPPVAGLLTLLAGVVDIVSALDPEMRQLAVVRQVLPGSVSRQAAAFAVVVGMLLVMLSRGLRRQKRRAWQGVVALLSASVALHLARGLDVVEAATSAALLIALILSRGQFRAKGDPTTRWRALGVGLVLAASSVVIGMALLILRSRDIVGSPSLSQMFSEVVNGLVGWNGPVSFTTDRFGDLVSRVLLTMGLLTLVTSVYLALRPPEPRPRLTGDDEQRLRTLLCRHGETDSLGYFALRRDKSVIWSPTGKAGVAYRVVSGVMLASGDPIGDKEAWPGAIKEFLAVAAEHAWIPAVIGCSELGGTAWTRAGLSALEFGDEAIVDTRTFTLDGRSMRNVRQTVNRVERAGYTTRVCRVGDLSAEDRVTLQANAEQWRGTETERGFSMALGRIGEPADADCVAALAFSPADAEGRSPRLRALLHFVPWGSHGLSLDLMVRDSAAEGGLNEFLIAATIRASKELGVERVSLNFAFFRSALERGGALGAGPVIRAWRGVLLFLSRWFQIESLYRFNAKFAPSWSPRYVCFPRTADLPRISLAMLEAEAFLVWPRPAWARRARRLLTAPARTVARRRHRDGGMCPS